MTTVRTAPGHAADRLPYALSVVTVVTSALVLFVPHLLKGSAATNSSARGTALVATVAAVPVLLAALELARRGSVRAIPLLVGALGYLLYSALLLLFTTPFDGLSLLFVAMMSLASWSLIATLRATDVAAFGRTFSPSTPVDSISVFVWVVAGLNALARIGSIARATPSATIPAYVQDLVFWLPVMALGAFWLRRRRGWGFLIVSSGLAFWVLEDLGLAVYQWVGHAADPSSPATSAAMTPTFVLVAGACLVPLLSLLVRAHGENSARAPHLPPAGARRWALVGLLAFVGLMAVLGGVRMIADGFGMPRAWLVGTGFSAWTLPGWALLVFVAVPQLMTAAAVARRWRRAAPLTVLVGTSLVLWVVVQMAVLQRYTLLQPIIAALGVAEVLMTRAAGRPLSVLPDVGTKAPGPRTRVSKMLEPSGPRSATRGPKTRRSTP